VVLATVVVRSAHKGESHGAVHLVDLESETHREVVRWSRDIDWSGRGFDRGLRGIAFHDGLSYIAASDEILVLDRSFNQVGTFSNRYLRHCHEISIHGNRLWVTSTGFDSLLCLDLGSGRWARGVCLRRGWWQQVTRRLLPTRPPRARLFDPEGNHGPEPGDTVHLNTVVASDGAIYCSGTGMRSMLRLVGGVIAIDEDAAGERSDGREPHWDLAGGEISTHARVPFGTHNVQPYREGVLMNVTRADVIRYARSDGRVLEQWRVPTFDEERLVNRGLPRDHARQGFGRGLCVAPGGEIIGGSSPATISRYAHGRWSPTQSLNLSMDVRHAIHGLEIWPYEQA
jgi:hypothetical protein